MTLKIKISKGLQKKIRAGYPWVFRYQLESAIPPETPAGDLGVIYDASNRFLAAGLYDPFSSICLRVLHTGKPAPIDRDFFAARFARALALRQPLAERQTTGYRALNGEGDGFPGLVLDRYDATAVLKLYSVAWLPRLPVILELTRQMPPVKRCVLRLSRNTVENARRLTGHENGEILYGPPPDGPAVFLENGLRFAADAQRGQKTGFYFDQRENRARIRELAGGKSTLNVCSYTGGFSVYAFAGGARAVTEIDINPQALAMARGNLRLNFPDKLQQRGVFRQMEGDAFARLAQLAAAREEFDLVILDPPAFAANKKQKAAALRAYAQLAAAGARAVKPGGILFAASCSAPVTAPEFQQAVDAGLRQANARGNALFHSGHAVDHPISFPEGAYLKAVCLRLE